MKKNTPLSAFSNPRILCCAFCAIGALLAVSLFLAAPAQAQTSKKPTATGKISPADAKTMAEGLKPLINDSAEGLVTVKRADGSLVIDLQGRFENVTMIKKDAEGGVSQACVNNLDAAAAFLGIDRQLLGLSPKASAKPLEDR